MIYDTSSFPAYLRSLNLENVPVTTHAGRMIAGPPAPVFELALRLGLGALILDTPRNRDIVARLGVAPEALSIAARRMRARRDWRRAWEELAKPHLNAVEAALAQNDTEQTIREINTALNLINMAYGGDGDYIHTPIREKREVIRTAGRLYQLLRDLKAERVERLEFQHPHGTTIGLLHFPPNPNRGRHPALLAMHGAAGDKDGFDFALTHFREAGLATFCIDLPAHGEAFDGPRLKPDDEVVGAAALDVLAVHPEIDPDRLAVMGGSLGAFYAQRTAAISPRVKACLGFASPFDIGHGFPEAVFGIQDNFAHVIGAPSILAAHEWSKPFHLRDAVEKIRCPIALVHGTQDHICDFKTTYEIARRARSPISIFPLRGADHEVAHPNTAQIANAGIQWLRSIL
ncbi:MAG TPA: alpha/beta fold hydrolase [Anaerolineales bacterium]|nr:alpha/beta fold hydrolase [Anaerolineales bacterium]